MIGLQNEYYEQLSGGNNKPILTIVPHLNSVNGEVSISSQLRLQNIGKTYLKNVEAWIIDRYKGISLLETETDSTFSYKEGDGTVYPFFIPTSDLSIERWEAEDFTSQVEVNTLPPLSQKTV